MSDTAETKTSRVFVPDTAAIKASMIGPIIILSIAAGLTALGLVAFLFSRRDAVHVPLMIDLIPLAILVSLVCAIVIVPWRHLRNCQALLRDAGAGVYRLIINPQTITIETRTEREALDFNGFAQACRDSEFLGNTRDFGGLVLSRTSHEKLSWKQRAAVVNAIRKGRVEPVTHDGITTIPLSYFGEKDFQEIIATVKNYHQIARNKPL